MKISCNFGLALGCAEAVVRVLRCFPNIKVSEPKRFAPNVCSYYIEIETDDKVLGKSLLKGLHDAKEIK